MIHKISYPKNFMPFISIWQIFRVYVKDAKGYSIKDR